VEARRKTSGWRPQAQRDAGRRAGNSALQSAKADFAFSQRRIHSLQRADGTLPDQIRNGHHPLGCGRRVAEGVPTPTHPAYFMGWRLFVVVMFIFLPA
jgi:hypothetical protein